MTTDNTVPLRAYANCNGRACGNLDYIDHLTKQLADERLAYRQLEGIIAKLRAEKRGSQ